MIYFQSRGGLAPVSVLADAALNGLGVASLVGEPLVALGVTGN